MKQTYEFLQNLAENNNREWFAENKHISSRLDLEYIFADNLAGRISEDFRKTADFVHKINMAVDYALEGAF